MDIKLYSFRKRVNSTKAPIVYGSDPTVGITLSGYLREPSSLINPIFKIKRFDNDASPDWFNYAYIPEFRRFYFITDWLWADGLWECHCKCDVLASWKSSIANIDAYVERCAGNADSTSIIPDWDGSIIDKMYPTTTNFDIEQTAVTPGWITYTPETGCFILGVFGGEANTIGTAVNYWALNKTQMGSFMSYLLSDTFFDNAGFGALTTEPLSRNMAKALMNPIQYISSCMWFPFSADSVRTGSSRNIQIGPYQLASGSGPQGYYLGGAATYSSYDFDVDIPIHPQAASRGKYLMYAPYSQYSLILPPFGTMPIDISYFEVGDKLNCDVIVDCITGKARLYLGAKDGQNSLLLKNRFYETSTQFGVPIQIAQVANDAMRGNSSIISAVTNNLGAAWSTFSGQYGAGIQQTGMWISSIGDAVEAQFPQIISEGVNGSFSAFRGSPTLTARFAVVIDENRTELGRPLCAVRRISSLSGYIQCAEVDIEISCLDDEEKMIKQFMTTGFFFE